jgi:hypothetical protein
VILSLLYLQEIAKDTSQPIYSNNARKIMLNSNYCFENKEKDKQMRRGKYAE